jgi:hypothetical protein
MKRVMAENRAQIAPVPVEVVFARSGTRPPAVEKALARLQASSMKAPDRAVANTSPRRTEESVRMGWSEHSDETSVLS